jgi:hypothetical protein
MASCKVLQDIPLRAQFRHLTGFPFQDNRLTMIRCKGREFYNKVSQKSSALILADVALGLRLFALWSWLLWHIWEAYYFVHGHKIYRTFGCGIGSEIFVFL